MQRSTRGGGRQFLDQNFSASKIQMKDVIAGVYHKTDLKHSSTYDLEKLVLKLIDISNGDIDASKQPAWWPDEILPFKNIKSYKLGVRSIMLKYHQILLEIIEHYFKFQITVQSSPPSMLKIKNSKKNYGLTAAQLSPVVKVRDILSPTSRKYPVLSKEDFLSSLKLQPKDGTAGTPKVKRKMSKRLEMKWISRQVPFSSNIGRAIVPKNLSEIFNSKQQEKYLRNAVQQRSSIRMRSAEVKPPVTYMSPRRCKNQNSEHLYNFPKRQNRQKINRNKALKYAFCKPVKVILKRLNYSKIVSMENVYVVVKREDFSKYLK